MTNIQIKAQFSANVAANTKAFAVVISDRSLTFQSDDRKCVLNIKFKKYYTLFLNIVNPFVKMIEIRLCL